MNIILLSLLAIFCFILFMPFFSYCVKFYLAEKNIDKYNNKLVHDKNENIRAEVAKHCDKKYLDILINDKDDNVRYEVAKRGFDEHLDILIYDRSCSVRCAVVQHGRDKDLDILINDENYNVHVDGRTSV